MEEVKLDVQIRKEVGARGVKRVRRENFVPGIVYGDKQSPTAIKVERKQYEKAMKTHHGQTVLVHIDVYENSKKLRDYSAIVRDEQYHPLSHDVLHVDFQRVSLKEKIEVQVPIEPIGEAVGVKKDGGALDFHLREIDVACLPMDIPEKIEVDVSALLIGDSITVGQLKLPKGVEVKTDLEHVVVTVVAPMKEEVEVQTTEGMEPEVIKEKKEKAEGEAAEAPAAQEKSKE